MTKTEMELVCAIIDKHTEETNIAYGETSKSIREITKLKNDIRDTFARINKNK